MNNASGIVRALMISAIELAGDIKYPASGSQLLLGTITDAMLGQDIDGIAHIRFDFAPQLADIMTRIINIIYVLFAPNLLQDVTLGYHPPRIFHQHHQ